MFCVFSLHGGIWQHYHHCIRVWDLSVDSCSSLPRVWRLSSLLLMKRPTLRDCGWTLTHWSLTSCSRCSVHHISGMKSRQEWKASLSSPGKHRHLWHNRCLITVVTWNENFAVVRFVMHCYCWLGPFVQAQLPSSFRQPHSVHCPPGSPHPAHITSSQSPPSLLSPITASTFHSRLKTHLFHKSFPP